MGNRCGDLAIYSGISCGAEILITPETGYDEEAVLEKLKHLEAQGKNHAIVIVSENVCDVKALSDKVSRVTGFSGTATILGHIQRGGSPTASDRVLASRMGAKAIELLETPNLVQVGREKQQKLLAEKVDINHYYLSEMDRLVKAGRKG